jgi:hypothetical protein
MIDLNNEFTIFNLSKMNYYEYSKLNKQLVIENMRKIFVFTHNPYIFYVKIIINNEIII